MRLIPLISLILAAVPCFAAEPTVTSWKEAHPDWVCALNDDFDGPALNPKIWSRIAYQSGKASEWMRYQSKDKKLVQFKNGKVILWGRHGKFASQDNQKGSAPGYACGSFYSFKKFSFQYGYVEVRAKFDCVQGCWPAIWLKPSIQGEKWPWPSKGEIDILEHLNFDNKAYQTIHFWNDQRSGKRSASTTAAIDKNGFNTYGLLWEKDRLTFYINGKVTKVIEKHGKNWPFDDEGNDFYLIIDQQIGGSWVEGGKGIDKETLSKKGAAFTIDYAIVYTDPKYAKRADSASDAAGAEKPKKKAKKGANKKDGGNP